MLVFTIHKKIHSFVFLILLLSPIRNGLNTLLLMIFSAVDIYMCLMGMYYLLVEPNMIIRYLRELEQHICMIGENIPILDGIKSIGDACQMLIIQRRILTIHGYLQV